MPKGIWSNESGATVVEHAILCCVIGLVIAVAVSSGLSPREMFQITSLMFQSLTEEPDAQRQIPSGYR